MGWVCSVSRNSWIFLQCCASAETPWGGLRPQSAEPGPGELALLQHAQKGCNTACQSPIAAPGSSKKASVPPYCSTQSGKMSGLAMTSGTRAGGSSSRGTPPPCHSAALHPLLGDKGGWNCSTSSRNTCSLIEACAGRVLLPPWPCTAQALQDEQKESWTPEMGLCMATKPRRMDKNQN